MYNTNQNIIDYPKLLPLQLTKLVSILFILFLVVVTMLYQPHGIKKYYFYRI
jgi:hypothetical protein